MYKDSMGGYVKSFAKAKVSSIHCSPLIRRRQSGWSDLPCFDKSTLTVPNHVHLLHVLEDDFREDLLHNFPGSWCKAEWPVVPTIFFLSLLEDNCDICIFPVIRNFS